MALLHTPIMCKRVRRRWNGAAHTATDVLHTKTDVQSVYPPWHL